MTPEHEPPRLSEEGARLLADVLATRHARDTPPVDTGRDSPNVRDSPKVIPAAGEARPSTRPLLPLVVVAAGLISALGLAFGLNGEPAVEVEVAGAIEVAGVDIDDLEVSIDSVLPPHSGVHVLDVSFTIPPDSEVLTTDRFTIAVEDSTGVLTTIVRFVETEIQPDGTATAMVRAEGAQASGVALVIRFDGDVIERLPLA